jgi:hypothetical protein
MIVKNALPLSEKGDYGCRVPSDRNWMAAPPKAARLLGLLVRILADECLL